MRKTVVIDRYWFGAIEERNTLWLRLLGLFKAVR